MKAPPGQMCCDLVKARPRAGLSPVWVMAIRDAGRHDDDAQRFFFRDGIYDEKARSRYDHGVDPLSGKC